VQSIGAAAPCDHPGDTDPVTEPEGVVAVAAGQVLETGEGHGRVDIATIRASDVPSVGSIWSQESVRSAIAANEVLDPGEASSGTALDSGRSAGCEIHADWCGVCGVVQGVGCSTSSCERAGDTPGATETERTGDAGSEPSNKIGEGRKVHVT